MERPNKLLLILGGSLVMALAGGWAGMTLLARTQVTTEIPSPDAWIPFAADVVHETPGTPVGVAGRFFRGTDGSSRSETWSVVDPSKSVVEIRNVGESAYYLKLPNGEWQRHPMKLPPGGFRPLGMRRSTHGLQEVPVTVEKFETYRLVGSRVIEFRAPQLNFFPILLVDSVSGLRNRYFNITLAEPDPALFRPPAGVDVSEHTDPMGIVVGENGVHAPTVATKGASCAQSVSPNVK